MSPKENESREYVVDELLSISRKITQRYSVEDWAALAEARDLLRELEDLLRKPKQESKRRARQRKKLAKRLAKHLKNIPPDCALCDIVPTEA